MSTSHLSSTATATRAVAVLVLLGIAAVLLVSLVPWPHHDPAVPDNTGLRQRVARECGISPSALYDEQEEDLGVYWWWTDQAGARHRASLVYGAVTCG